MGARGGDGGGVGGGFVGGLLIDTGFLSLFGFEDRGGAIEYVLKMKKFGLLTEDLGVPRWLVYLILLALSRFSLGVVWSRRGASRAGGKTA